MERQKAFAECSDSDQSISEEEECVSLRGLAAQKEKIQILSQLELQKGCDKPIHSRKIRNLSYEKEECLSLDDDVQIPANKNKLNCSPRKASAWKSIEEVITNDKTFMCLPNSAASLGGGGYDRQLDFGSLINASSFPSFLNLPWRINDVPLSPTMAICPSTPPYFVPNLSTVELPKDNESSRFSIKSCHGSFNISFLRSHSSTELILPAPMFEKSDPPDCGNKRQDGSPSWWTINQEAEALMHENKVLSSSSSHSTFSKVERPCQGIGGKGKPKFSFHFQSQRRELSLGGTTKDEQHALFNLHKQPERESNTGFHFPMECLEDIEEENDKQLDIKPVEVEDCQREHRETSIAELLNGLQDNTSLQSDGIVVGRKVQIATKSDLLLSCDRHYDNEDSTKSMNSDSPSDCEDGDQNLNFFIPQTSRQTITDKFEEFLGATSLDTGNAFVAPSEPSRIGLFGKLKQVMQTEKLRDVDFLDMLNSETSANDETDYLDVKILGKDFEAKLIVCSCLFYENLESSLPPFSPKNMKKKKKKVIFNPRVCNNVDLGVGTFIRIHAPWKEISVGNGESIILSTYFSETSSLCD